MVSDPTLLTIREASTLIAERKLSPVELTKACIARTEALDATLSTYVAFTPELALEAAEAAEVEIGTSGPRGRMQGIPVGLKDIYDTADVATTAHSNLLKSRVPTEDAFTVAKLRESGAVITGKLGTFEFRHRRPLLRPVHAARAQPWDAARTTGGSSSGSGAAVAAGMVLARPARTPAARSAARPRSAGWPASSRPMGCSREGASCRYRSRSTMPGRCAGRSRMPR